MHSLIEIYTIDGGQERCQHLKKLLDSYYFTLYKDANKTELQKGVGGQYLCQIFVTSFLNDS